jgi:hypothetical protein
MPKEKRDQLLRIIAQLDGLFAADDCSPADADRWQELKRHITRLRDALLLVETTLREERERGIPLTADTGRKLEGYARFGLGEKPWAHFGSTSSTPAPRVGDCGALQ